MVVCMLLVAVEDCEATRYSATHVEWYETLYSVLEVLKRLVDIKASERPHVVLDSSTLPLLHCGFSFGQGLQLHNSRSWRHLGGHIGWVLDGYCGPPTLYSGVKRLLAGVMGLSKAYGTEAQFPMALAAPPQFPKCLWRWMFENAYSLGSYIRAEWRMHTCGTTGRQVGPYNRIHASLRGDGCCIKAVLSKRNENSFQRQSR